MIDTHCHLNFNSFDKDIDEVIKRAFDTGVKKIINVGTKIDSSKKAVDLAEKYENIFAAVGIHPHHADKSSLCHPELDSGSHWLKELEQLAKKPKVVAIGEIGMDYYRYQSNGIVDTTHQKEVFIKQIKLAYKLKLPLQIHNRHAGDDILNILIDYRSYLLDPPGMFHCFSGDIESTRSVLDLGFYVGFDGNITYKGLPKGETVELKELAKYTPLDRIVVETDSPFLTPEPFRGGRNEPKYAILVGEFLAKLKGVSLEEIDLITTQNARKVFHLSSI